MSGETMVTKGAPPRWSVTAYAFTAIGLGGAIAATILILTGYPALASPVAGISWALCLLQSNMSLIHKWPGLADFDDPLERMRFDYLGAYVSSSYLLLGLVIEVFQGRYGEPIVLSHNLLLAVLFAAMGLGLAVPRATRLWRGPPPRQG